MLNEFILHFFFVAVKDKKKVTASPAFPRQQCHGPLQHFVANKKAGSSIVLCHSVFFRPPFLISSRSLAEETDFQHALLFSSNRSHTYLNLPSHAPAPSLSRHLSCRCRTLNKSDTDNCIRSVNRPSLRSQPDSIS